MTDYTKRTENEAKTLEMLDGFQYDDYYTTTQCVKMVWRAQWALSLTVERIHALASLLGNIELDEENVRRVLRQMVAKKVLRSQARSGTRFYEVNY